ncbi:MAG: hypothetical protein QM642_11315, partial [Edaphocola sp.]
GSGTYIIRFTTKEGRQGSGVKNLYKARMRFLLHRHDNGALSCCKQCHPASNCITSRCHAVSI